VIHPAREDVDRWIDVLMDPSDVWLISRPAGWNAPARCWRRCRPRR
jgi:hypothetical protein